MVATDVDEIPDIRLLYTASTTTERNFIISQELRLRQDLYYYNINCQIVNPPVNNATNSDPGTTKVHWDLGFIINYGTYITNYRKHHKLPQDYRMDFDHFKLGIANAGWHLSYFGNIERIVNKLNNFIS